MTGVAIICQLRPTFHCVSLFTVENSFPLVSRYIENEKDNVKIGVIGII